MIGDKTMTNEDQKRMLEIAHTIIQQMGGESRLIAMVNMKDALILDSGVQFRFSGSKRANKVVIELTPNDLYTMTFYKMGRFSKKTFEVSLKKVDTFKDIYNDMLIDIFETATGLYLRL